MIRTLLVALLAVLAASRSGTAQAAERPITNSEALALDANQYAVRFAVTPEEALWRLRAQQESVTLSDAIRRRFKARLAGISIEHVPSFQIRVLLTGTDLVPPEALKVAGRTLPIVFVTGASATREQADRAMVQYQAAFRDQLPNARGMGHDQSTGDVVLLVTRADADLHGLEPIRAQAQSIAGVPVRIEVADRPTNLAATGGGRVEGVDPANGRRYACTTGFVVTDGQRNGIVTAAHCPNDLVYRDEDGGRVPLSFDGQWGWRYRDVQLHVSPERLSPLFYSDRPSGTVRQVTGWRNRTSLRAGEWLCHYGESSGYSCEVVELTDYSPPRDLCGGACAPTWVTVSGPVCRSGDSGGPVFIGGTAVGITKGGSNTGSRCNFYYFMSTDFLPEGWRLLHGGEVRESGEAVTGVKP
nr:S1 family peptidase [Sphingomonas piscis]